MLLVVFGSGSLQDYGPSRYHATAYNTPVFNGQFVDLSHLSNHYMIMPAGMASTMGGITTFTSCVWLYLKSVRPHQ